MKNKPSAAPSAHPVSLTFDELQALTYARLVEAQKRFFDTTPAETLARIRRVAELQETAVNLSRAIAAGNLPGPGR